ncbi:MAG: MFS transporter [Motilibacteraceae bacterium]
MSTAVVTEQGSGVVRDALRETRESLREVFAHPPLRRIQLALTGSMVGDWAYATAVTVWAYGVGGTRAVGIWAAVRFIVMAVAAPFAAGMADRWPRKRVMVSADLVRAALVTCSAVCIAVGTPAAPVFVLATVSSLFGSVFRPAQAALLPSLAERPEQLTAANGVSSTIESMAFFVGPALGALLLTATNVETVFLLNAASYLWSAALVAGIAVRATGSTGEAGQDGAAEGRLATIFAGFREISGSPDLRVVATLVCAQTVVAGASSVFAVALAVQVLPSGPRGVGYVDAVLGVGALVGGFVAIYRSSRGSLVTDLLKGVLLWSLPLLLVVAWPSPLTVFVAVALLGFGNPIVDVNFYTAVQRLTPDRVLGRVFGALEGALIATMALGAAVMPFLIDGPGLRTALAVVSLVVGLPTIALLPAARGVDRRLTVPPELDLLSSLPIFAPLGPAVLDGLARRLVREEVPAGTVILAQGDVGDRFYVIRSGRVGVTHGEVLVRHEGPGDYFGEIALLRDVPRTATVTATEPTVLLSLERAPFLEAVTGSAESARVVEEVVSLRTRY